MKKMSASFYSTGLSNKTWISKEKLDNIMYHRQQRMAEIMATQKKAKYGSVKEISAVDYVDEVNKAGDGVWVVLHLYKSG